VRLHPGRLAVALAGTVATAVLVGSSPGVATAEPTDPAFAPQSMVWPTATDGYLLGGVACDAAPCAAEVLATHDGGKTWATAGRTHNGLAKSGEPGLTSLKFATKKFGWAYDPFLEVTRDGGRSWTQIPLPGGEAKVLSLYTGDDGTYVVTSGCEIGSGVCDDRPLKLWHAPAGKSTGWKQVDVAVAATDHVSIDGSKAGVYVLAAGFNGPGRLSTLRGGKVRSTSTVTCADTEDGGIVDLATNAPGRVFVLCMSNYGRGHSDKTLMVSGDGGKTFRYDTIPGSLGLAGDLSVGPDGAVMITTLTASLVYNRPALSKAWRIDQEWLENSERIHDLVQQTPTTAWLVERDAAYTQNTQLWISSDAGASWQQTTVVPTH
jgi:photosystem II stability/assembly factor-like uncharacterized protein